MMMMTIQAMAITNTCQGNPKKLESLQCFWFEEVPDWKDCPKLFYVQEIKWCVSKEKGPWLAQK